MTSTPENIPTEVPTFPTVSAMHNPKRRDVFVAVRALEAVTNEMLSIHDHDPLNMTNSAVGIVLAPANPSLQPKNESFVTISARMPRSLPEDVESVDLANYFTPEVRDRLLLDAHEVRYGAGRKYVHVASYFLRGVDTYNVRDISHPELNRDLSQGIICLTHNHYIDVMLTSKAEVYSVESTLNLSEFVDTTWSNTFIRPLMDERFEKSGLSELNVLEATKTFDTFMTSSSDKATKISETVSKHLNS